MRTTLDIDADLLYQAMQETGAATETDAVRLVLEEFLEERRKRALVALRAKIDVADDLGEFRALDMMEPSATERD
jgi:Arc/MetJ family transcription regulator